MTAPVPLVHPFIHEPSAPGRPPHKPPFPFAGNNGQFSYPPHGILPFPTYQQAHFMRPQKNRPPSGRRLQSRTGGNTSPGKKQKNNQKRSPDHFTSKQIIEDKTPGDPLALADIPLNTGIDHQGTRCLRLETHTDLADSRIALQTVFFQRITIHAAPGRTAELMLPRQPCIRRELFVRRIIQPCTQSGAMTVDIVEPVRIARDTGIVTLQAQPLVTGRHIQLIR